MQIHSEAIELKVDIWIFFLFPSVWLQNRLDSVTEMRLSGRLQEGYPYWVNYFFSKNIWTSFNRKLLYNRCFIFICILLFFFFSKKKWGSKSRIVPCGKTKSKNQKPYLLRYQLSYWLWKITCLSLSFLIYKIKMLSIPDNHFLL